MKYFYLITNEVKDPEGFYTRKITAYLAAHGGKVVCTEHAASYPKLCKPDLAKPEVPDCILVLGGDGTLLRAARNLLNQDIPLLGINLGTLGYLAEVDRRGIFPALDKLLQDDYEIEKRMMLQGTVYHGEQVTGRGIALNDIVIGREGPLRVICLRNYVNGEYLNEYKADGIIVATPTGSTGYSLSAGGPIVAPKARMTVITPLAPHTLNSRSIILPGDDVITVEIGEGRHQAPEEAMATFDGDISVSMVTGDRIVIEKAQASVGIIKMSNLSFVEVMRRKMSGQ